METGYYGARAASRAIRFLKAFILHSEEGVDKKDGGLMWCGVQELCRVFERPQRALGAFSREQL